MYSNIVLIYNIIQIPSHKTKEHVLTEYLFMIKK